MRLLLVFVLLTGLFACNKTTSLNPLSEYFYPLDTEPLVYVYRDVAKGIDERFHRVYRIDDSFGEHIVVEIYSAEARLLEAYNYNIDSLNLMDHMVVDGKRVNQKGDLSETQFFPMGKKKKGVFQSRFPGPMDSTFIQYDIDRKVLSKQNKLQKVMDDKEETIVFQDDFVLTLLNSIGEPVQQKKGRTISYYSKGYGLTRWRDEKKELDFQLEKIMTEVEWAKIVSKLQ
jgi:hypothetical protein